MRERSEIKIYCKGTDRDTTGIAGVEPTIYIYQDVHTASLWIKCKTKYVIVIIKIEENNIYIIFITNLFH